MIRTLSKDNGNSLTPEEMLEIEAGMNELAMTFRRIGLKGDAESLEDTANWYGRKAASKALAA